MTGDESLHIWDYYGTSCQKFKFNLVGTKSLLMDEENLTTDTMFEIFPNPSINGEFQINITGNYDDVYSVSVISLDGKTVYSQENIQAKSQKINTNLDKGIYLVKIALKTNSIIKKLVVK